MPDDAAFTVAIRFPDQEPIRFRAARGQSIVRAAAAAGFALTTGCLQGRCAICRARLADGEVVSLKRRARHAVTDPANRADGCVLLCSVAACSDLTLDALGPWTTVTR